MEENQIKDLIAKGDIAKAIIILRKELQNSNLEKECTLISSRFENLLRKNIKGIIMEDELKLESNKIADSILQLIDEIENDNKDVLPRKGVNQNISKIPVFLKLIIVFVVLISTYGVFKYVENRLNESGFDVISNVSSSNKDVEPKENRLNESGFDVISNVSSSNKDVEPKENRLKESDFNVRSNVSSSNKDVEPKENRLKESDFNVRSNESSSNAAVISIELASLKTKQDIILILRSNPNLLKKAYSTYSSIDKTTVLELFSYEDLEFDFAIYSEGINAPDFLCLLKIDEINDDINWNDTQKLINKFKKIDRDKICQQLKNRKEISTVIRICPEVAPILITRKRVNLTPADLEKFKEINLPSNTHSMYDILSSYDRFLERINK